METNISKKQMLLLYLKGTAIGLLVAAILLALFALLFLNVNLSRAFCAPFATLSVALGVVIAAWFTAYKIGDKGYKVGGIIGLAFFVTVLLFSLMISHGKLTENTGFHFVIFLLSGVVGGVVGVNRKHLRKLR